jgi:hypothetical protein
MSAVIILSYVNQVFLKTHLFKTSSISLAEYNIRTNPNNLLKAANYALKHFNSSNKYYSNLTKSSLLEKSIISRTQTKQTLKYMINIIKNDARNKRKKSRILNSKFLQKYFTFIKWNCDKKEAIKNNVTIPKWYDQGELKNGKIKLTSYAVFKIKGSYYKTKYYPHALYEIKSKSFKDKLRQKYSKQTILQGVLEKEIFKKHIKPLVWVSRKDLEEALMQGSIIAKMPDKKEKFFNICVSNGLPYNKKLKNKFLQNKYWYFKEIQNPKKIQEQRLMEFVTLGGSAFAGDIESIGIGKIIALRYKNPITKNKELYLGILADKGSAFSNNLYQIDLFSGILNNKRDFYKELKKFPPSVEVYILKKKG